MFFYRGVFGENGGTAVCGLQIYAFFVSDKCGLGMKKIFCSEIFPEQKISVKKTVCKKWIIRFPDAIDARLLRHATFRCRAVPVIPSAISHGSRVENYCRWKFELRCRSLRFRTVFA